ncbi:MAG: hypothetical protein QXJ74_08985 [Nitrososphaera sp.]
MRTLVQHRVNLPFSLFSFGQSKSKAAIFLVIILGIAPALFSTPKAFACSCAELSLPSKAYEESDAVFAGTAENIVHETGAYRVHFAVERAWKGITETPLLVTTPDNDGLCGYRFQEGVEYLVYAHGKDSISTGICTRTQPVADAYADLAYLGSGYEPTSGPPVIENTPEINEQNAFVPFIGIGAAIAGAVAFLTLRNRRR